MGFDRPAFKWRETALRAGTPLELPRRPRCSTGVEGRPRDERELALRARRGDSRAYADLVRPHQEIAFRVAYVITRNAADAEDATQDGLVKAWRALGRFRAGEPLRPWLLEIVANEARNRRRSAGRREHLTLRASAASPGEAAPSPEDAAVSAEARGALLAALEELPADARDVLVCRYLLGLSEEETAAALGIPAGTVKSRSARALDRLREIHEPRG
jgi:RNA polymerase sigma factor (sigma-70 family)